MSKISFLTIKANNTLSAINENFNRIKQEMQDKLFYRNNTSGETNTLITTLDANGNDIINADVISGQELVIGGVPVKSATLGISDVIAGTNVTIDKSSPSFPIINVPDTKAVWGNITGTLASQTDLNSALALKANTASLGSASELNATATGTSLITAANDTAGRSTLNAAKSGVNSDITQLTGITSPLSIAQGGTGANTASAALLALGAVGRLLNVQTFAVGGTYTPTPGTTLALQEAVGGGGAGGGAIAHASAGAASGGGAGTYGWRLQVNPTAQTVTIGAAGVPATGANGGAGGQTSIGSQLIVPGGAGGLVSTNLAIGVSTASTAIGGAPTNATVAIRGQAGSPGFVFSNTMAISGMGGSGPFGWGGMPSIVQGIAVNPGAAGNGFGAGGSGAVGAQNGATQVGGAGTGGFVRIYEFGTN